MKVTFKRVNDPDHQYEITYPCESVKFGIDGRDLYAVTHELVGSKVNENFSLIARFFKSPGINTVEGWHPVDANSLLYFDLPAELLLIEEESTGQKYGVKPYGNTDFEQGWSRGYDAGFEAASSFTVMGSVETELDSQCYSIKRTDYSEYELL